MNEPDLSPPLTAFDLFQARAFVLGGPRADAREESARRTLAAVPLSRLRVPPGRGWIESDDGDGNTRFAFVEVTTVASDTKVLATVGVEAHANEAVWAVRVAGRLADSYSRDNEQDLVLAQRRAEELVGIDERESASASPTH